MMRLFDKIALPVAAFYRIGTVAGLAWAHELALVVIVGLLFATIDAGYVIAAHRLLDNGSPAAR